MNVKDPNRPTLSVTLDGREVKLVPVIIEGYRLEVEGKNVTSFLSKTPPIMRAVGALEGRGDFGVGDLETASDTRKWTVSGPVKQDTGKTDPAEKN
ncbi:hypothetical protein ACTTAK_07910 [Rhodobacter capsulatus]|uniref:hypothetical protein n=1 Tax=Rhodobacter capsulatus TaxID=1061 RepID=UPI001141B567|nr:hypothetical protein [Rhodobacter capsulatus]TQD34726.1 hypothetical protein FKW81_10455 [Rhodobacter capsulatus]